jgi:hypothetical protein
MNRRRAIWQLTTLPIPPSLLLIYEYQKLIGNDPDSFQRGGSLMVALGVSYFALGYSVTNLYLDAATQGRGEYVRLTVISAYLIMEIFLVVVGTLIWGYGDLFVCWYHCADWSTCPH